MRESIIQTTINKFLTWLAKKSVTVLYRRTHFWTFSWGLDDNTDLYLMSEESYPDYHRFGVREERIADTPQTETSTNSEELQSGVEVKQTDCSEKPNNSQTCANCKFDHEEWFEEACDSCCDAHSNWQPKTEPQTDPCDGCVCDDGKHLMYCMNCKGIAWKTEPPKVETEPQTCANGCKWLDQDGECTEPNGECHIEYRTSRRATDC